MPVIQEAFYIPDDIATGLATGLFKLCGGVVRYARGPKKGQIVKHLDPVDLKTVNEAGGVLSKVAYFAQKNQKILITTGLFMVAAGCGLTIYHIVKNKEPSVVKEVRTALKYYISAIRTGTMEINYIERLIEALNKMKQHKDYNKFIIELSAEDIEILVKHIYDYTLKLAKDNDFEIGNSMNETDSDPINNLQYYLSIQKKIFESAA